MCHNAITVYISLNLQVGYYLVQNQIIVGRWMHINWYTLASRQVSMLAL